MKKGSMFQNWKIVELLVISNIKQIFIMNLSNNFDPFLMKMQKSLDCFYVHDLFPCHVCQIQTSFLFNTINLPFIFQKHGDITETSMYSIQKSHSFRFANY